MIKFLKIKKSENFKKGITLIEIIITVFIIALFSTILIANFPEVQRQFALSRATYKLAQDLRRTEDLSLSGLGAIDINGDPILVKGYGIYVDSTSPAEKYIIYADVDGNQEYSGDLLYPLCDKVDQEGNGALVSDCVMEIIDVSQENKSLGIKSLQNIGGDSVSINFSPPNPIIKITDNLDLAPQSALGVGIILGLNSGSSSTRAVWINTSGLISIQ